MPSKPREFSDSNPVGLIAALRLFEGADSDWSDRDLADMLTQQLDAPLDQDLLDTLSVSIEPDQARLREESLPPIHSLRQLFAHPRPPHRLLTLAKDFAKVSADHPTRPLPRDLARVLYYCAIIIARRHGFEITRLDPASFAAGLQWASQLPWLDDMTRGLLRSGM